MRPTNLKISRIETLIDVSKINIKPIKIMLPAKGGIVRVAVFGNKLCLFVEHDVAFKKEEAYIHVYKDEQEFRYRPEENYVGTFFKDEKGYRVYIGNP
jgi:hypothetical protein